MPDLFIDKFDSIRIIDSKLKIMNIPNGGRRKLELSKILFTKDDILILLEPVKVLGSGVYGHVVGYKDKYDRTYAIKIEGKEGKGTEHELLKNKLPLCGQILSRVLAQSEKTKSWYIMLEFMNGELDENAAYTYFEEYSGLPSYTISAAHIVEQVRRQVVCLLRANPELVYADMKVENVLYRLNRAEKTFEVKLGDLGSLSKAVNDDDPSDKFYQLTFPCLPLKAHNGWVGNRQFESLQDKLDCLSYQVGLLLLRIVAPYFYDAAAVSDAFYYVDIAGLSTAVQEGWASEHNEDLRNMYRYCVDNDPNNKTISKAGLEALARLSDLFHIDINKRRPIAKIEETELEDGSTVMTLVDVPLIGNGKDPLPMKGE